MTDPWRLMANTFERFVKRCFHDQRWHAAPAPASSFTSGGGGGGKIENA
jgi:hypothetical protein